MGGVSDARPAMDHEAAAPELVIEGMAFAGGFAVSSELADDGAKWLEGMKGKGGYEAWGDSGAEAAAATESDAAARSEAESAAEIEPADAPGPEASSEAGAESEPTSSEEMAPAT
jgi:hypothetical protein